jgi:O-succinylbenzoate synthase
MRPSLTELLATARVVDLALVSRFRGIDSREALLVEGPQGWSEFSPFVEYADEESAQWLAATIDFGWNPTPLPRRSSVPVNATLPAVAPDEVAAILDRFGTCRTVKIKVAQPGQLLSEDVARVAAARDYLGPEGRIRVDANGGWNVDEAEHAIHALAGFDLEYVEQPCASVGELFEVRARVKYMGIPIAADESVRKATDPLVVARAGAADVLVLKAQPLGGVRAAMAIASEAGLPIVVSSALDTAIGLSMGLQLAASVAQLEFDCGLATSALFVNDVSDDRPLPVNGSIDVRRIAPTPLLLDQHAATPERRDWWLARLSRCYELLTAREGAA